MYLLKHLVYVKCMMNNIDQVTCSVILCLTRECFGFCIKKISYPSHIQEENSNSRRDSFFRPAKLYCLNNHSALVTGLEAVLISECQKENLHNCLIDGEMQRGTLMGGVLTNTRTILSLFK